MPAPKKTEKQKQDEIAQALEGLDTVEAIALKLWWGWTPMTKVRRWLRPGNHGNLSSPMKTEELQWFKRH